MPDKKIVLQTDWFEVESEEYKNLTDTNGQPFYRIKTPESVIIVALDPRGHLIMIRQFRPASGHYAIELPAGGIDRGESLLTAAHREFTEETGYQAEKIKYVACCSPAPDRIDTKAHLFFSPRATKVQEPEPGVELLLVPPAKLREIAQRNPMQFPAGLGCLLITKWILNPFELTEL